MCLQHRRFRRDLVTHADRDRQHDIVPAQVGDHRGEGASVSAVSHCADDEGLVHDLRPARGAADPVEVVIGGGKFQRRPGSAGGALGEEAAAWGVDEALAGDELLGIEAKPLPEPARRQTVVGGETAQPFRWRSAAAR